MQLDLSWLSLIRLDAVQIKLIQTRLNFILAKIQLEIFTGTAEKLRNKCKNMSGKTLSNVHRFTGEILRFRLISKLISIWFQFSDMQDQTCSAPVPEMLGKVFPLSPFCQLGTWIWVSKRPDFLGVKSPKFVPKTVFHIWFCLLHVIFMLFYIINLILYLYIVQFMFRFLWF